MRIKTKASKLRVGMVAYLPYYGRLLRAKITVTFPARDNQHFIVRYVVLSEPSPRMTNECCMKKDSQYEVYKRPQGKKS